MKRIFLQPYLKAHPGIFVTGMLFSLAFTFLLAVLTLAVHAQGNKLSLADILIALRSKKVTLPERNKILTDAVITRGTTFSLTPEIEKELSSTGAEKILIDSIRQKSEFIKIAAVVAPPTEVKPKVVPVAAPPPPDFSFYVKRADDNVSKGDLDAALADYSKAIQMNGSAVSALLGRGALYYDKGSYKLAIDDYTRAVELSPKSPIAYARRGEASEKLEKLDFALADYKKALELDGANESVKAGVTRIEASQAKTEKKPEPVKTPPPAPVIPEFVNLGQLSEAGAIRMVKPIYSQLALKSNIGGKVEVEVELDIEGNVTSAKAVSGHSMLKQNSEEAARKCKFNPAKIGNQAVKAKGIIVYNFVTMR